MIPVVGDSKNALRRREVEEGWLKDPTNPVLLTYPRSGSNWFALCLECYYQENIAFPDTPWSDNQDFKKLVWMHTLPGKNPNDNPNYKTSGPTPHNIMYLYRKDPVAVIYSYIEKNYRHGQNYTEEVRREKITWLSNEYSKHVYYYALEEDFSKKKTVFTYEELMSDMEGVFRKVATFFDEPFDLESLVRVEREVTKESVIDLLQDFMVGTRPGYQEDREVFRDKYKQYILDTILSARPGVRDLITCE